MNNYKINILELFGINVERLEKICDLCELVLNKTGASEEKKQGIYEDIRSEYYYVEGSGNYITENIISAVYSVLYDYLYGKYNVYCDMNIHEVMMYVDGIRINEYEFK